MKLITKKNIYLLILLIITLLGFTLTPSQAKFVSGFTTEEDIVGVNFAFNISISNIEEYEEISIDANSYEIFNVEITNSTGDEAYYGIWYKMVRPKTITDDIIIARLEGTDTTTSESISNAQSKVVTIIVKNNTNDRIKFNLGIASSTSSTSDIEYLGGKKLITGTANEIDYYYDLSTSKYISTSDSTIQFSTTPTNYTTSNTAQIINFNHDGIYKLEAWGAQGGSYSTDLAGGKGAYTSGIIELEENAILYLHVGSQGGSENATTNTGGYNGGGASGNNSGGKSMGGGGATDFRLTAGEWDDATGLRSRIMVAAGGGGNAYASGYTHTVGYGGALTGGSGGGSYNAVDPTGGNQISAGEGFSSAQNASFGYAPQTNSAGWGGGGGSGYYAGANGYGKGGAGGSSYVSGYRGCVAVTSSSDSTPKTDCDTGTSDLTCSYHYSNKVFSNPTIIAGDASMPTQDGTSTMTGNSGDGYAKVTSLVPSINITDTSLVDDQKLEYSCVDNGSGCKIIRTIPSDTDTLTPTDTSVAFILRDDYGYVYKYEAELSVTISSPSTPVLTASENGGTSLKATYSANDDTTKDVTYTCYYGTDTNTENSFTSTTSACAINNLNINTTYYVKICAFYSEDNYTCSQVDSITTFTGVESGTYTAGNSVTYGGKTWKVVSDNTDSVTLILAENYSTGAYGSSINWQSGYNAYDQVNTFLTNNTTLTSDKTNSGLVSMSFSNGTTNYSGYVRLPLKSELSTNISNDSSTPFWTMTATSSNMYIGSAAGTAGHTYTKYSTSTKNYYNGYGTRTLSATALATTLNETSSTISSVPVTSTSLTLSGAKNSSSTTSNYYGTSSTSKEITSPGTQSLSSYSFWMESGGNTINCSRTYAVGSTSSGNITYCSSSGETTFSFSVSDTHNYTSSSVTAKLGSVTDGDTHFTEASDIAYYINYFNSNCTDMTGGGDYDFNYYRRAKAVCGYDSSYIATTTATDAISQNYNNQTLNVLGSGYCYPTQGTKVFSFNFQQITGSNRTTLHTVTKKSATRYYASGTCSKKTTYTVSDSTLNIGIRPVITVKKRYTVS